MLKDHPDVSDALVCGRPSERWGSEVAALVVSPSLADPDDLLDFCRGRLARYKAPKYIRFVDHIVRTATGKPDYRWALQQVLSTLDRTEPVLVPPVLADDQTAGGAPRE